MKVQNILSINQLMEREITYFMHKYCNKQLPAAFEEMLNKNTSRLSSQDYRQTRCRSNLFFLFCRIYLTKQSLSYRGLLWNKIPLPVRENKSFGSFRKIYNQHVLM